MIEAKKSTVLFVAYGASHVQMIIPLLRNLGTRPDLKIRVLALTTAGNALRKEGIPYFGFRELIRPTEDSRAIDFGKLLSTGLDGKVVPIDESIAYLGLSYTDLVDRLGEKEAEEAYRSKGRQAFLPLRVMERLFNDLRPELIVTTISPRAEQAAIMTAHSMGIPSICMIDHFDYHSIERAGKPGYGDTVCVLTESVKKMLIEAGRRADEISVTGNPAFDELADEDLLSRSMEFRRTKGWDNEKVILWASHKEPIAHPFTGTKGDPSLPRRIEKTLFEIIERHPEWRLVVRPHPNEQVDYGRLPDRVESSGADDELAVLLNAVDAVVVMTSMVGLQGSFLGKPVVSVDMSVFSNDAPYKEIGFSLGIDSLDELEGALQTSLSRKAAPPDGFPPCGQATENVIKIIDDILAGKSQYKTETK